MKRKIEIEDLRRIVTPSDPQMSPDGTRIAFVLKTMHAEKSKYFSHIWVAPTAEGGVARQWTYSQESESSPRWSPDGRYLAFTSGREEKKGQIFLLPMEGGEAEKFTALPQGDIADPRWSPDGARIAFRFRPLDPEWREDAVEERQKEERPSPPRVITRLHYREEGKGVLGSARYGIHILDVATRAVTPILSGADRDYGSFCWSPDGTRIAYVANMADDPDLLPNAEDLFVIPAGGGEPARLPCPRGPKDNLTWSPDGGFIAYLGHDKPDEVWGVTNVHPWIVPLDGGSARDLTRGWDVHCGSAALGDVIGGGQNGPVWSGDGKSLLTLASERGAVDVYSVTIDEGGNTPPKRFTEGAHAITGFTADARGEHLALLRATPSDAGDLYALPVGSSLRRLTWLNQDLFEEVRIAAPRSFDAPTPEGHTVPCQVLLPPEGQDSRPAPHPTVLYLHGGPHLMYAHTLFYEYQILAAAGYAVLYPNPRGSKGYGEAWTEAIKGNWGESAQADVMACVDYALHQNWSDPERLGVAGGSYGGYLAAWVVGHTGRFAAAVAERGVYNLLSMAGTCDFVWVDRGYFNANTWDDPAEYLRNSPLTYAGSITTPLLLIHSEGDLRCPIEQAEQLYAALKRQKKEAVFLRYGPESNHDLSRGGPVELRLDRLRRILAWFDRFLSRPAG